MIRGLYTSGWSMMALEKKMDVISNNMANVNTTGYKKDSVVLEGFPALLTKRINDMMSTSNPSAIIGDMEMGFDIGEVFTYHNQGQLVSTGSSFDMALQDSDCAFFVVAVPDGEGNYTECYTRDGAFKLDSQSRLVTNDGYPVLGENGAIYLYGEEFSVEGDGTVIQESGAAGKLLIREFDNTATLRKFKDNLLRKTTQTNEVEFSGSVVQGCLEQSNVNPVNEMVDIITVMRAYEANQKCLQIQDDTLQKVVNEVGAVR